MRTREIVGIVCAVAALALMAPGVSPATEPAATSAQELAALGEPLAAEALDDERGGDDTSTNIIRITGDVTDNTARNVETGANTINDGSFANASGITSVVQNTGANVLIQTATIVTVEFVE